jgi:hypothetical protein
MSAGGAPRIASASIPASPAGPGRRGYPARSGSKYRTQLADLGMATDVNRHPDLPMSGRLLVGNYGITGMALVSG